MARTFEELVAEGEAAPVAGWDFSWLEGRATEQRPSWGYQRMLGPKLAAATAALDLQTGGGEVLAGARGHAPITVATEAWPPNLAAAARTLRPHGVHVVAADDAPNLPFAGAAFDLVVSRHPVTTWWEEIARVLRPGGTYFSQQVPASVFELVEHFLGPSSRHASRDQRRPGPWRGNRFQNREVEAMSSVSGTHASTSSRWNPLPRVSAAAYRPGPAVTAVGRPRR
jgi:SAM-dependent methyltransferase